MNNINNVFNSIIARVKDKNNWQGEAGVQLFAECRKYYAEYNRSGVDINILEMIRKTLPEDLFEDFRTAYCASIGEQQDFNDYVPLAVVENIQEKEIEWLVPEYIPKGQITIMAGDGGVGKTTVWCSLAAAVSRGEKVFFDKTPEEFAKGRPGKVLFFSSEDSVEHVLKARLRKAGADLNNIACMDLCDERFQEIKFNSPLLKRILLQYRPDLVIFDPLQSFIPANTEMSRRNAMRAALAPLIGLGDRIGATSLIILHTNKRAGAYGRARIADSADIYDIARSVLIVGKEAGTGLKYLVQDKTNYGKTAQTALFTTNDGVAKFNSYTDKTDCDFVREAQIVIPRTSPKLDDAKEFIMDALKDDKRPTKEIEDEAQASGITKTTLRRAKEELRSERKITSFSVGYKPKIWYLALAE